MAGTSIQVQPGSITITITDKDDAYGIAMLGPSTDGFSQDMYSAIHEAWPMAALPGHEFLSYMHRKDSATS